MLKNVGHYHGQLSSDNGHCGKTGSLCRLSSVAVGIANAATL